MMRSHQPLTLEAIRRVAPSVFATAKHESRSNRFTYIPTSVVLEGLMNEGFLPFEASQSSVRFNGDPTRSNFTKHMIRLRHQSNMDGKLTKVGDSLPEVILINAHDGSSAYKLMQGVFRLVCSNGMIVSDGETEHVSVAHKGNIVDKVIEGSIEIIGQSHKALQKTQEWSQLQLTGGEQRALAAAVHTVRFPVTFDENGVAERHPIQPEQLLEPRRWDDKGNDLWRTTNRIQENVIRGGLQGYRETGNRRNKTRRVTTKGIKGIDQNVNLNKAIWMLTEEMAKLKTA